MPSKYTDVLNELLGSIEDFLNGKISIQSLQTAFWNASDTISLPEERTLSDTLKSAEGQLEMIRFTVDSKDVLKKAFTIAKEMEAKINQIVATA